MNAKRSQSDPLCLFDRGLTKKYEMKNAIFNWSGGKDSALCLYHVLQDDSLKIKTLFTSVNECFQRISMHGVRVELLKKQAESLHLPLRCMMVSEMPSMREYDNQMERNMSEARAEGITHSIFGDIFLEDLREYRERQLSRVGMEGIFPLWQQPTSLLLDEFISLGFKAIVVCVNQRYLDESFLGREIDESFKNDLPEGIDPCGENGEFHSFVYDGPIFSNPIECEKGETVFKKYTPAHNDNQDAENCPCVTDSNYDTGFWYCDLK
jgi:uncharacterized protein (TIGR00290 family)